MADQTDKFEYQKGDLQLVKKGTGPKLVVADDDDEVGRPDPDYRSPDFSSAVRKPEPK